MPSLWFRVTSLVFVDEWVGFGFKKVTKVSSVGSVVSPRLTLQATHVTLPLHTNCVLELLLGQRKDPKALLGPQAWLLVA